MRHFLIGIALALCLSGPSLADPVKLSWSELHDDGNVGALRRAVADFPNVGPLWLTVYLPPGYSEAKDYPVLYVMDGHALFDGKKGTWELDETLEKLCNNSKMQKIIVVGVHTRRLADGSPESHPNLFDRFSWFVPKSTFDEKRQVWQGGKARVFLNSLLQVKKIIDNDFSTNPNDTGIMGSSLGGIFAEYAGFKRSDIFQHVAVMSPSLFLKKRGRQNGTEDWRPAHDPWPGVIWMDFGTHEGDYFDEEDQSWHEDPEESQRHLDNALEEAHWLESQPQTDSATRFRFIPYDPQDGNHTPARHNELSWAIRVEQALPFLYPP